MWKLTHPLVGIDLETVQLKKQVEPTQVSRVM